MIKILLFKKSHICIRVFNYDIHIHYFNKDLLSKLAYTEEVLNYKKEKNTPISEKELNDFIQLNESIDWYFKKINK